MRVIAGSAKGLPLKTPKGMETRPTADRIKETLFNILAGFLPGASFLDLFAGSGGIGIEALSRGAREAVFVEVSPRACSCIRANLAFTGLEERACLLQMDALKGLRRLSSHGPFSLIFMDPPYDQGMEKKVLEALRASALTGPDTLLVLEASLGFHPRELEDLGYGIERRKIYKTNQHIFMRKKGV